LLNFAGLEAVWQQIVSATGSSIAREVRSFDSHKIVVLPALSRPRMRMRTSLLPKRALNTRCTTRWRVTNSGRVAEGGLRTEKRMPILLHCPQAFAVRFGPLAKRCAPPHLLILSPSAAERGTAGGGLTCF
jgi:hypothetical protein